MNAREIAGKLAGLRPMHLAEIDLIVRLLDDKIDPAERDQVMNGMGEIADTIMTVARTGHSIIGRILECNGQPSKAVPYGF